MTLSHNGICKSHARKTDLSIAVYVTHQRSDQLYGPTDSHDGILPWLAIQKPNNIHPYSPKSPPQRHLKTIPHIRRRCPPRKNLHINVPQKSRYSYKGLQTQFLSRLLAKPIPYTLPHLHLKHRHPSFRQVNLASWAEISSASE